MKKVMVRAWEIARDGAKKFGGSVVEYLSESMKLAWKEVKAMFDIKKLEEAGAGIWEKYGYRRLYLNKVASKLIGLEYDRYNTGNISSAKLNGEHISNSECNRILNAIGKAYINLEDNTLNVNPYRGHDEDVAEAVASLEEKLYNF